MKWSKITGPPTTELFGYLTAEELADIALRDAEIHSRRVRCYFSQGNR